MFARPCCAPSASPRYQPDGLDDAAFFLACGVRMVRGIASSYGHRPTAAATLHLLRRLLLEAGKLGAVDLASASLVQHLGGAVTERLATSTAEALYASYRMARLGIIVMDLADRSHFGEDEVPSVASLVAGVVRRRSEPQTASCEIKRMCRRSRRAVCNGSFMVCC